MSDIGKLVDGLREELVGLRRDFHTYPELGFQEIRTSEKIEQYLQSLGLKTVRVATTGVVAVLEGENPEGPVLLMRADMDALPVAEETGLPFSSVNTGVMHACGHDGHMAMMLTAAKILSGMTDSFSGKIKFVFQPNEEIAGAQIMINQGVLENPTVDAAMGVHLWSPIPTGRIGIRSGAVMASMDVFKIRIVGKGGHTGYPDSAVDPVICAAQIISQVQTLQTRFISPMKPIALMFGRISGGSKGNIIPESVELEGTIRYLYSTSPGEKDYPTDAFRKVVDSVCVTYGCSAEISIDHENDAVVNDSHMTSIAYDTATKIVGKELVVEHQSMACEDFAAFAENVPAVFAFIGTASNEAKSTYPHHNPKFTIDESSLSIGVEYLVSSALAYFSDREAQR